MNATYLERARSLAVEIYGESEGRAFFERLARLLTDRAAVLSSSAIDHSGIESLTEKDALLISYGDMLATGGDAPVADESALGRLRRFLEKRVPGRFSLLHLLPFFPYSSDDGFSVIDYRAVDPRLGTWSDIDHLADSMKLTFDLVLNHGSAQSPDFAAFLAGDPARKGRYLTRPAEFDASAVVRPRTHPLLTPFTRPDGSVVHVWTTFSADQVDFDFGNPAVLLDFIDVLLEYAAHGARMIRLDAIAYLWKEDGTPCLHHPKTHAVVKLLRAVVDALGLDLLLLTETNVFHTENISYFGEGDEAHLVYNFALPPLVLHAAVSGDAQPLRSWAAGLADGRGGPVFLNFLASHDGIGVTPARGLIAEEDFARTIAEAQARGGRVSYKATPKGPVPYELNCVYLDAVAPRTLSGGNKARADAFLAANAVMLALAGLPAVYFHSWIGSENWIEGPELWGYNRAINRMKPTIDEVERELADPVSLRSLVYAGLNRLLEFRSLRAAFAPSAGQRVLKADASLFALIRGPDREGHSVLCLQNLGPRAVDFTLPADVARTAAIGSLKLGPWETRWLDI